MVGRTASRRHVARPLLAVLTARQQGRVAFRSSRRSPAVPLAAGRARVSRRRSV